MTDLRILREICKVFNISLKEAVEKYKSNPKYWDGWFHSMYSK